MNAIMTVDKYKYEYIFQVSLLKNAFCLYIHVANGDGNGDFLTSLNLTIPELIELLRGTAIVKLLWGSVIVELPQ